MEEEKPEGEDNTFCDLERQIQMARALKAGVYGKRETGRTQEKSARRLLALLARKHHYRPHQ